MVTEGDIVVIQSGDNYNPYYLLYATSSVSNLSVEKKNEYGHIYRKGQSVIQGYYLEEILS